jgi:hypothetical protein
LRISSPIYIYRLYVLDKSSNQFRNHDHNALLKSGLLYRYGSEYNVLFEYLLCVTGLPKMSISFFDVEYYLTGQCTEFCCCFQNVTENYFLYTHLFSICQTDIVHVMDLFGGSYCHIVQFQFIWNFTRLFSYALECFLIGWNKSTGSNGCTILLLDL